MTVTSRRSTRSDLVRSVLVAILGVVQIGVAVLVGGGVAAVADAYRTPLVPAGWTFAIWGLVYAGFLACAVYQLLPRQRTRHLHRRTGWWLVASGVFNAGWVLSFAGGLVPLAELLLIGLLISTAVVFGRQSREPSADWIERIAFRVPMALYTGWVSLATMVGTAATGVWMGLPGDNAIATVAAVLVLLAMSVVVAWVVLAGTSVVGYTVAAAWALIGIALNEPPFPVQVVAVVGLLVVLAAMARRLSAAGNPARAAWG